jgi:phosphoribosylamine--glycine ligase
MKIFIIGNGGREHTIIWKLTQSPKVTKIYCTLGNAGINELAEQVDIKADDTSSLVKFAKENKIDFTVVGPEVPLSLGIVDEFEKEGMKIFGPSKYAAQLESSKVFAKEFMQRHNIPTSAFEKFSVSEREKVLAYLAGSKYPIVIKADGLAAGKGVVICENADSAKETIKEFFDNKIFGSAGECVVIEEFLTGQEASVFAISDGKDYVVLPPAQDHKKILDGEKGKNTGGMGSFAPASKIVTDEVLNKVKNRIIEPVLKYMKEEGHEFKGCLYCGLMINKSDDPYVIEFNVRFGDPETQVVLPLIESDFLELLLASAECNLKNYLLKTTNRHHCSVVLASKGYPDNYESGKEISGLDAITENCIVFHAGTKKKPDGRVVSSGGRVLNVVGHSDENLKGAIDAAYKNVNLIHFENKYFRTDIGKKGLR